MSEARFYFAIQAIAKGQPATIPPMPFGLFPLFMASIKEAKAQYARQQHLSH